MKSKLNRLMKQWKRRESMLDRIAKACKPGIYAITQANSAAQASELRQCREQLENLIRER